MSDISDILRGIENGDAGFEELIPLIHHELRSLAAKQMRNERTGHTLNVTALVNEAFLRLAQSPNDRRWNGRPHFFSAAAEAMRRVLIDYARQRNAVKRGGNRQRENLDLGTVPSDESFDGFRDFELLELDRALVALEKVDAESASVIKLRFFAGLTYDQVAEQLGTSRRTAQNHWAYAKAWLRDFLQK